MIIERDATMFDRKYTNLLSITLIFAIICGILVASIPGLNHGTDDAPVDPLGTEPPQQQENALFPVTLSTQEKIAILFSKPVLHAPMEETIPEETQPPETEPIHTHTYKKTVVKPTPAYRGYTEYRCECGESYRNHYTDSTLSAVTDVKFDLSDVPAQMLNSDILQALEYLGVNVQKLKNSGVLYRLNFIGSRTPNYARSPIPYSASGSGSGQQTVADSSTPTGLAPDLSAFRKTGLDCVDFAAYYFTNYLPNIKGADISILEAMNEKYSDYFGRCYDHMDFWPKACSDLAKQGLIEAYTYDVGEDYTDVFSKISPGTLIQMGNKKDPTKHYAIYAGSFNGNHYIIHSGNVNRGPEISLITYMWSDNPTNRDSWPVAFYEFHFPTA